MEIKKTPLYRLHIELGAKMVPFAGWEMPLSYSGIIKEHWAVRNRCGLFDVSHMGRIEISGSKSLEAIQYITTNDASRLKDGQVQYTILCNEDGGAIDDVTLYRSDEEQYLLCVNASNRDKVYGWIREKIGPSVDMTDLSDAFAQVALQGPLSCEVLRPITDMDPAGIEYYNFKECAIRGVPILLSRTGYTGEDGFEIYIPVDMAETVWQTITDSGAADLFPAGLGARDMLRLEKCYPLYGHELDEKTGPLEAGLGRFVAMEKDGFIGKDALRDRAVQKRLVAIEISDNGIPRERCRILKDGVEIGSITSGTFSPVLKKPIALGYVEERYSLLDTEVKIAIRKKTVNGRIVKKPFYKRPSTVQLA